LPPPTTFPKFSKKEFKYHKIKRVQIQFSAQEADQSDAEVMEAFMEKDQEDLTVRYEMEVDGKAGSRVGSFELLFDARGKLLNQRDIVRRPVDNLLY